MKNSKINFKKIEEKWQELWEKEKIFEVKKNKKNKFYVLEMFPYPSGRGLHMGHAFNYVVGDVYARFKKMQGFNVLHPMGYDSFGLPAENAAIKEKTHPEEYTKNSIKNFIKQQKSLGISYDWSRVLATSNPEYYKWDQWIFLKMFEKGLAYKKNSNVNWCPSCKTVLANEQAQGGICERCKTELEIKKLEQWFLKISKYSEELYEDIKNLDDWPNDVKLMQENWIGKSKGAEIDFKINEKVWKIFTTRPDTIYGVTFMVISAQHPKLMELVTKEQKKEVEDFLKKIKSTSEKEQKNLEKEGAFTGSYAVHPITKKEIPIYVGNFVVADYGSGMVMAVPAHDQRDFEFAKKYNLEIKQVISSENKELKKAFTGKGKLINSEQFNELENEKAKKEIVKFLEEKNLGREKTQFKLRDWLISRQRYWGAPIPIVYCEKCGIVPVPEKDLPVELPKKVKFGEGNPLETNKGFIETTCPKCNEKAKRETDTMDTFVNSSWYFLRYCDAENKREIFDKQKANYWMPIDVYIGGKEHACMHLIYFRFYTKFLRDLGLLNFDEPVKKLFNQGMLHGEDGAVMSKSRGNGVLPEKVSEKFGIDTARLFLVSIANPDKDIVWSDKGIEGTLKFIKKIFQFSEEVKFKKTNEKLQHHINKTIKQIAQDIENFKYNLAVIKLRELFEKFEKEISKSDYESFLKILSIFAPHISEELWEKIGNKKFISTEKFPKADEKKINEKFDRAEELNEKISEDILNILKIVEDKGKKVKKVYVYSIPNEVELYDTKTLKEKVKKDLEIFAVNEKNKYDPEAKSKKAKPGKPAIFVE